MIVTTYPSIDIEFGSAIQFRVTRDGRTPGLVLLTRPNSGEKLCMHPSDIDSVCQALQRVKEEDIAYRKRESEPGSDEWNRSTKLEQLIEAADRVIDKASTHLRHDVSPLTDAVYGLASAVKKAAK